MQPAFNLEKIKFAAEWTIPMAWLAISCKCSRRSPNPKVRQALTETLALVDSCWFEAVTRLYESEMFSAIVLSVAMGMVDNANLTTIAQEVEVKLKRVVDAI